MQLTRPIILIVVTIVTFFLILFLYSKLAGPIPFYINSVTTTKTDTFQVTGEGTVESKPDLAVLQAGVQANGQSVQETQDQINSSINKVSAAVKGLGVDPKDIQTTNYNVNPTYDFSSGGQRITGYTASTNLEIKVRKIDQVNAIIDSATKNGANQVNGPTFEVSNKTALQNEARQKAVADAKKKAEEAAKTAGFKLGRMINYAEDFGNLPVPVPLRVGGPNATGADTKVESGSSEVKVTVTLSYEVI